MNKTTDFQRLPDRMGTGSYSTILSFWSIAIHTAHNLTWIYFTHPTQITYRKQSIQARLLLTSNPTPFPYLRHDSPICFTMCCPFCLQLDITASDEPLQRCQKCALGDWLFFIVIINFDYLLIWLWDGYRFSKLEDICDEQWI